MDTPSRQQALERLVALALAEDLGPGDLTSEATVPESAVARAVIVQKQPGVISGLDAVEEVYCQLPGVALELSSEAEGDVVVHLAGTARNLLAGERVALNFLGHLSGVATLTRRFVEAVDGTGARILDTRKTTPGMRLLEKEAVAAGGGTNHRIGLFDAVLIKENHVALAGGIAEAVSAAREMAIARAPNKATRVLVQVECETIDEVRTALATRADRILLDNMSLADLRNAVAERDATRKAGASEVLLEASGGISLENVREIAETGVDLISIGTITHSAPTLDLSMLIEIE